MKFWNSFMVEIFKCWKFGVFRSKDCKVTGHQTLQMIRPRAISNLGRRCLHTLWPWRPKSAQAQSLMVSNFVFLWPTDPKFSAFKDLNPFSTMSKVQEASRILKMGFTLSKWPHLLHKMGFVDSLTHTTVHLPINMIYRNQKNVRFICCIYLHQNENSADQELRRFEWALSDKCKEMSDYIGTKLF